MDMNFLMQMMKNPQFQEILKGGSPYLPYSGQLQNQDQTQPDINGIDNALNPNQNKWGTGYQLTQPPTQQGQIDPGNVGGTNLNDPNFWANMGLQTPKDVQQAGTGGVVTQSMDPTIQAVEKFNQNPEGDILKYYNQYGQSSLQPGKSKLGTVDAKMTNTNILGQLGGAGLGFMDYLLNKNAGQSDERRRREQEVQDTADRANIERARLENMRPEEIQQAKAMELEKAKDESISAASTVAAGNVANSGLGGDVNSAVIAGIKAAAPTLQAAAPYAQAKANTLTEMERAIENKNQMLEANNRGRGQDAYAGTDYIYGNPRAKNNLIASLLKGSDEGLTQWQRAIAGVKGLDR